MADIRDKRNTDAVRTYFKSLPDAPGVRKKRGVETIESFADEHRVKPTVLRQFRDGKDAALSSALVTAFSKLLGADGRVNGVDYDEQYPFDKVGKIYQEAADREERMRQYDLIDKTRPEAHSALDAWADLCTTGSVGDTGGAGTGFTPETRDESLQTVLDEAARNINTFILPGPDKTRVVRGMGKYGDQWGEAGLAANRMGEFEIAALKPLHARTMFIYRGDDGKVDPDNAYAQMLPWKREPETTFPLWKIVRFSNQVEWGDEYGQSIFYPCLRSYVQLEAMEAAMIIRRLERAPLRYKHIVDVGHVGSDQYATEIENYKKRTKKRRTVDTSSNYARQKIGTPPEDDLYVARRSKESVADVEAMQGDAHLAEIADFIHFFHKWLSGLGPPKAHLGYESDTMRSVITDLHIVFARKARRMQMKFMSGLNHLYWLTLILKGIDPRSVDYRIVPPAMGTRDELIRAQILQTHATAAKLLVDALGQSGKMPGIPWILKEIMGFDHVAIEELGLVDVMQISKQGLKNTAAGKKAKESAEMASIVLANDEFAKQVYLTKFLAGERSMAKGLIRCGDANDPFKQSNFAPIPSWKFDELVKSMGITTLRRLS